jgi:hypothetical protein
MSNRTIILLAASIGGLGSGGCVTDYGPGYGDYGYSGGHWAGPRQPYEGELDGPGVELLDRWLIETAEGRAVVTLGFSDAANGFVTEDVAHRANIWFRRYADENRDLRITDPEIRTALVTATGQYLR